MRPALAQFYSCLCYAALVSPALVNRTIDDEHGDSVTGVVPSYLPIDSWRQGSRCKECNITPAVDPHQALISTCHDTLYAQVFGAQHALNPALDMTKSPETYSNEELFQFLNTDLAFGGQ